MRFRIKVAVALRERSGYNYYWFGFPVDANAYPKYQDFIIFACGYADGLPEKLYLIHAGVLIDDGVVEPYLQGTGNAFQVHIEDHFDGTQWLTGASGSEIDIGNGLLSLDDLLGELMLILEVESGLSCAGQQRERELLEDFEDLKDESQESIRERTRTYRKIIEALKRKYKCRCQIEGCGFTFEKRNGGFYSEGHHLVWVSEGGSQKDEANVVILCPNHHRMLHYADVEIGELQGRKRKVRINGMPHFIAY